MSKSKLITLSICAFLFFCSVSAFANSPYSNILFVEDNTLKSGTPGTINNVGDGYTSVEVTFATLSGHGGVVIPANQGAIYIVGDSAATLSSDITLLKISTVQTSIANSRHGIVVNGYNTSSVLGTASLTVSTTDKFTIDHDVPSGNAVSVSDGTLSFKGPLEITTRSESGTAMTIGNGTGNFKSVTITAEANSTVGLNIAVSSKVTIDGDLNIHTKGTGSRAMFLRDNDGTQFFTVTGNTTITTSGANLSHGIHLYNFNAVFNGNLTVVTEEASSSGIYIHNGGTIEVGGDLYIETKGEYVADSHNYNRGMYLSGTSSVKATITVGKKTTITTAKAEARGINIQQYGDITFNGETKIITAGDKASAIHVQLGAEITFNEKANISTSGEESYGIYVVNDNSSPANVITFNEETTITTNKAAGMVVAVRSDVIFNDFVTINTSQASAYGVYISADSGTVKFNNGASIVTQKAAAIRFNKVSATNSVFKNVYAESVTNFVLYNSSKNNLAISFAGTSELHSYIGSLEDSGGYGAITLTLKDTSFWQGTAFTQDYGKMHLVLKDSSAWKISEDDSYVDSLTMESESKISFVPGNTFYTATVDKLSGQGTFVLNVDMSLSGRGNKLHINDASGTYKLDINDLTSGRGGADRLTVITADAITNTFVVSLLEGNEIRIGAYNYILESTADFLSWDLVRSGVDEEVVKGSETAVIGFSEFAKSVDALLSDELLNTRKGIWAVASYKLQNFKGLPTNLDLKQNIYSVHTGIELNTIEDFSWGLFLGLSAADQKISDIMEGNLVAFTLGLNGSYSQDNLDVSGYMRAASYFYTLDMAGLPSELFGSAKAFGLSASIQVIDKFYISNSNFYLAPKVKASYTYISDFAHDFGPFVMTLESENNLVSWLGVKVGGETKINAGNMEVYLEAGWVHDFNPEVKVSIDGDNILTLGKNRFEAGVGLDIFTTAETNFAVEYKCSFGKNITEPIKLKLSASTAF